MMFDDRRARRQANRAFDHGEGVTRYRMRQKAVSLGDDYWVDDASGEHVYKVNGKVLRLRRTWSIEDRQGNRVARVQSRPVRIKDSMEIEDAAGNRIALVKQALVGPVRDRWRIKRNGGEDLRVRGSVLDHEYTVERDGIKVAEVSKKWFRLRDTYGLDVADTTDHATILAAAIAIDAMTHPGT